MPGARSYVAVGQWAVKVVRADDVGRVLTERNDTGDEEPGT